MEELGLKPRRQLDLRTIYHKQGYRLLGRNRHSAVKICRWTKESLRASRVCYKEKWYPPVQSHRCMQITPCIGCNNHCLYCWRLHSEDRPGSSMSEPSSTILEIDSPEEIIEEAIEKRRELLSGFKGNQKVDLTKFKEALNPTMVTLSLSGEPTLYQKVSDLNLEAEKRGMITFLVTNGTTPEALEKMDPLPFQLYVSVSAPDKKTHIRIVRPLIKNGWERLNRTLELLPSLETRKVIRLTAIRGWNMKNYGGYADLINKAEPDFVEVKAYEWVGESQKRLPKGAMPSMDDVRQFAQIISNLTGYDVKEEFEPSGAVLLSPAS